MSESQTLEELLGTIELSSGEFVLLLARCNYDYLRSKLVQQLQESFSIKIVDIEPEDTSLYRKIETVLGTEEPDAVMVLGLESVTDRYTMLTGMNKIREEFRKRFHFPLILWVDDERLSELIRISPDFTNWGTTFHFQLSQQGMLDFLREKTEEVFDAAFLGPAPGDLVDEIKSVFDALQDGDAIDGRLKAAIGPQTVRKIAFCLGESYFAKNRIDAALEHYHQSLEFWQAENSQEPLREGVLRERIGLCYASQKKWAEAKHELQASLEIYAEETCLAMIDRLTGELGEVLRNSKEWDELETLARESLERDGSNAARKAYDYGYLAEVARQRQQWQEAKKYAELALNTWTETPVPARFFLMLARASQELGDPRHAIACLKEGKDKARPQDDPQLYVNLLGELRDRLYERREYWKAFEVKKFRREVRYQFGLRAFIGPGLLQQRRIEGFGEISSALAASGRKQDIDALVARISQPRHKLTTLYGPSGVGKSSLVQGGLVPALQDRVIECRHVLPVVVRAYADWVKELGIQLHQSNAHSLISAPNSLEALKAQLQSHADRYLTVLIFDQFEEFFFICDKPGERREFYQFLADCLRGTEVKFVKVILSLREDYLHELLELEAFLDRPELELESDILRRDQRYYLGNYSQATAISVISDLTGQTQLSLEPELVNALVEDLADELGEIRPIELQVVGAQLESKGINTFAQYRDLGDNPKSDLAKGWIENVVHDCGTENIDAVWQLLTALTSEKMTRPLRTVTELSAELETYRRLTDGKDIPLEGLILKILVGSGLVVQWPQEPEDRYQLVHDYLVSPIRQKYNADYRQRLEQAEAARKEAEEQAERERQKAIASLASQLAATSERLREQHGSFYTASGLLAVESANMVLGLNENSVKTDLALRNGLKLRLKFSRLLPHDDSVEAVCFSSDDAMVATASRDKTARIWNVNTGAEIARLPHDSWVKAVSFSSDDALVATASDNTARIWNVNTGAEIARFPLHSSVRAVCFSSDGAMVATTSWMDNTARIWNVNTGAEIARLLHDGLSVEAVCFSSDDAMVATKNYRLQIWNTQTGAKIARLPHHFSSSSLLCFSSDDAMVATASYNNTARIWDVNTGEEIARLPHDDFVEAVCFSSDDRWIATASRDNTARIWNVNTEAEIARLSHDDDFLDVNAVCFSSDDAMVATASDDNTARIWNVNTGAEIARLPHNDKVNAVCFSSDDAMVATASDDNTARIWNVNTGAEIARLPHDDSVEAVCFSSDNAMVATVTGWNDTAQIWNAHTGAEITRLSHDKPLEAVCFSSDGAMVATASHDDTARIWNVNTGAEIARLPHDDSVYAVCFSSDDALVATASWDKTARIWNVNTRAEIVRLPHDDSVLAVCFSSDDAMVATVSMDNTARIWNVNTGEEIARLPHDDSVEAVCFSSDDAMVATASDNTAQIWWRSISDLRDEMNRRLTRNLTASEWKDHVDPQLENYRRTCPQHPVHPSVVEEAKKLAQINNPNARRTAEAIFQRVKELQPDIDLDRTTETVETDPKAIMESAQ